MTRSITAEAGVDSAETVTLTGLHRIQGNVPVGGKALATGTVLVTSGSMYLSTAIKNGAYSAIVESGKTYVFASATDRSAWRSVVARSDGRYTLDGLHPGHYVLSASTDRQDLGVASTSKTYNVVAERTMSTSVTVRKPVTHKGAIVLKIKASSTVWKRKSGVCAVAATLTARAG